MQDKFLSWSWLISRGLVISLLSSLWLAGPALAQSPEEGQASFQQKCGACHTVGGGPLAGPDLEGVTTRRAHDWLVRWIMVPDQMLSEGDPTATQLLQEFNNVPMPNLGVTEGEALALITYFESASGGAAGDQPAAEPQGWLMRGDVGEGLSLFVGDQPLQQGGPACLSCHSIGTIGELGGGTLGPDLTHAATRYGGEAGMQATLVGLPFPTMQGVFNAQPLSPDEVVDLQAFLVWMDQTAEEQITVGFLWIGAAAAGFIVLVALSHLLWRKRQKGVRQPLVGR